MKTVIDKKTASNACASKKPVLGAGQTVPTGWWGDREELPVPESCGKNIQYHFRPLAGTWIIF